MKERQYLYFLSNKVKEKYAYQNTINSCPFCDIESLSDIISKEGNIILLKNKFSTLQDTFQTVIIETDDCNSDITTYSIEHMRKLITFAINNWIIIENSNEYKSVILYKNHGNLSGGTIKHAHMQIVGLNHIDYNENISNDNFTGYEIYKKGHDYLNISEMPLISPIEFNIVVKNRNDNFMADTIQIIVNYVLNSMKCHSYNMFFYKRDKSIICKIVPRYVTSPFFIGYLIPSKSDRVEVIIEDLKRLFHPLDK